MKIQKSSFGRGWWDCACTIKGEYFVGSAPDKLEAFERCWDKIYWFFSLK